MAGRVNIPGEVSFTTVESHTAGMPTRIVTGGFGTFDGDTTRERMQKFQQDADDMRLLLMREPRGHSAMCGAILQPPLLPDADIGVLFVSTTGHLPMCGHAAIAVSSLMVSTGLVDATPPATTVRLDTAAGLVTTTVDGTGTVTITNPAARALALDVKIRVAESVVRCDLGLCGGLYAVVGCRDLGLDLDVEHIAELTAALQKIMAAIDKRLGTTALPGATTPIPPCEHVILTEFEDGATAADAARSLTVHRGFVDRSPCGTGTSAWLATLYARKDLGVGGRIVNRSLSGGEFVGRIAESRPGKAGFDEVITQITGRSWVTGHSTWLLTEHDPFPTGFSW